MADENAGRVEYGRLAFIGPQPGTVEYGRLPSVGTFYYTLTVQSSGAAGVSIDVTPADVDGSSDGTTPFTRIYAKNTNVTLTAPAESGGKCFDHWEVGGVAQGAAVAVNVTMDGNYTAEAFYVDCPTPPPTPITESFTGIEMLKVILPKHKFWTANYPNLEEGADGRVIPEAWGEVEDITPVCIDTEAGTYKISRRELKAIDAVRADGETLTVTTDYTEDLANGEFTLLTTPVLEANTTYYFVLESDYAINGTDYLGFCQDTDWNYADGELFYIDNAGAWTGQSLNLFFAVYVKDGLDQNEYCLIDQFWDPPAGWTGHWNAEAKLRQAAGNTRIAQSFKTPAAGGPWYISRIHVESVETGTPSAARITRASILSAYNPAEVQVGGKSFRIEDYGLPASEANFPQRGPSSNIRCDIQGLPSPDSDAHLVTNLAEIVEDIYVNLMGGTAAKLNAADMAALEAARTEDLAIYLNTERQWGEINAILEAGQLWKFLPSLAGDFALKYYEAGEPAGTPHLFDEHVKNLKMRRVWKNVFWRAVVNYDQNPSTGEYKVEQATSDIAQYVYNNQETLEVLTYLKDSADAAVLAEDYLGVNVASGANRQIWLQFPTRLIEFEVRGGYGINLIPSQKIKMTLSRADYPGGSMAGVLFRVLTVTKNLAEGGSTITAVLDSLTY